MGEPRAAFRNSQRGPSMLLENQNAVIYGAGGAIGSAVAPTFAREGAKVFVTGRDLASVETLAREIVVAGGSAHSARVDALDEEATFSAANFHPKRHRRPFLVRHVIVDI